MGLSLGSIDFQFLNESLFLFYSNFSLIRADVLPAAEEFRDEAGARLQREGVDDSGADSTVQQVGRF
jgi:hypothetical protein